VLTTYSIATLRRLGKYATRTMADALSMTFIFQRELDKQLSAYTAPNIEQ